MWPGSVPSQNPYPNHTPFELRSWVQGLPLSFAGANVSFTGAEVRFASLLVRFHHPFALP